MPNLNNIKPPYSYSHLALYEACPTKHNYERILKLKPLDVEQHPAAIRGTMLHEACELYINNHIDTVPHEILQFLPVLKKLRESGAKSEVELACTIDMEPCTYDSPDAFFYGIIDTLEVEGEVSQVGDWKSGKKRDYSTQLGFYALLQFLNSESSKIITRIRYLDLGLSEVGVTYTRRDIPMLWEKYTEIVNRMRKDRLRSPKPSENCKYCPFNRHKMGLCKW